MRTFEVGDAATGLVVAQLVVLSNPPGSPGDYGANVGQLVSAARASAHVEASYDPNASLRSFIVRYSPFIILALIDSISVLDRVGLFRRCVNIDLPA